MTASTVVDPTGYLARFGYLATPAVSEAELAAALRRFQAFYRLPVTGTLDEQTAQAMARQRCAMPDPGTAVAFTTRCAWDRTTLTYAFDTGTADVRRDGERDAVRRAIATWTAATPVAFREVHVSASPDIRIGWRDADHADADLGGNSIAHADYPPGCSVVTDGLPKPVHFDDSEHTWAVGAVSGALDVESVALHELGHILGLDHSAAAGAVMAPSIAEGSTNLVLSDDDLEGIQRLYPLSVTAIAKHSGLALDAVGASREPSARLQQFPSHGGANQIIRLKPVAARRYRLVMAHSGLVLTIPRGSMRSGAVIVQRPCTGEPGQLFRLEHAGGGYHNIVADHSGLVLDIVDADRRPNARVVQWEDNGGDNQRFRIFHAAVTARHSGQVLDVPAGTLASGAPIQQFESNGRRHQRLRVEPLGDGTHRLIFRHSGKVLDVADASTGSGAPMVQFGWHGGANQRFRVEHVGDGYHRLVAVHSGRVVSVAGDRVVQADWRGADHQQWRL